MGELYWIGLALGLGVSFGLLLAGLLASGRAGIALAVVAAAAAGAGAGALIAEVEEAVAGGIGGVLGAAGSSSLVRGAMGRGGARAATGFLLAVVALVCAALAFVPLVGYVEAVVLPALGLRMRRREGDRYAGLRILARD